MYTLDEINTVLSDLDACGNGDCRTCSRADHGRVSSLKSCIGLDSDAAAVIRWLLSEFHRYSGEQMQLESAGRRPMPRYIDANALQSNMMEMVASGLYGLEDMIDAVIEAPTVSPDEVMGAGRCNHA